MKDNKEEPCNGQEARGEDEQGAGMEWSLMDVMCGLLEGVAKYASNDYAERSDHETAMYFDSLIAKFNVGLRRFAENEPFKSEFILGALEEANEWGWFRAFDSTSRFATWYTEVQAANNDDYAAGRPAEELYNTAYGMRQAGLPFKKVLYWYANNTDPHEPLNKKRERLKQALNYRRKLENKEGQEDEERESE